MTSSENTRADILGIATGGKLVRVRDWIIREKPALVSFDVFDTLLWRPCRRPADLFLRVGETLGGAGVLGGIGAVEFASLRVEAERDARRGVAGPEITFSEIIDSLAARLPLTDRALLAATEFQVETDHLFGYRELFDLMEWLRANDIPYVFCSDMYFSSDQILHFLRTAAGRLDLQRPEPEGVFVSCEQRTGKSGRLFDILTVATGVAAREIVHIGDNPVSDVEKPRAKGIRAIHIPRTCDLAEEILDAEEQYLPSGSVTWIDYSLATTRKEMISGSLAASGGRLTHYGYGQFVVGPVLAAFAAWVATECSRQGITRVHCILREGHFLARVLDVAKTVLGTRLDVRTVLSSRFCLRAAGLVNCSEATLLEFIQSVRPIDVQPDLFLEIGLFDGLEAEEWLAEGLGQRDLACRVAYALEVFRSDPDAVNRVSTLAAKRRQGLQAYLSRLDLNDGNDVVFVDLGWGGTMQSRSLPFLREIGFTGRSCGFYLGTDHRIERLPVRDCPWQGFLFKAGEPAAAAAIVQRTPELIEQFCMSPHGSLREFAPSGEPIFCPNRLDTRQLAETQELQAGALEFAARWLPRFVQSVGETGGGPALDLLGDRLRAILTRSIDRPRAEEVDLFADWHHDSNNGSEDSRPLLGDADAFECLRAGRVRHPSELDWLHSYWPQGLFTHLGIAWSRPPMGVRVRRGLGVLARRVPAFHRFVSLLRSLPLRLESLRARGLAKRGGARFSGREQ